MVNIEFFNALGDPIRFELVQRLVYKDYTINALCEGLNITRQGIRKHLQILIDAEIVSLRKNGRENIATLHRESLEHGKAFISELEAAWDKRLDALRKHVENQ